MLSSLSKINRRQKAEYYLVQRMHWKTSHTFLPPNPDTGKLFRIRIHSIFRILSKYQKRVYFTVNLPAFSISVVLSFSRSSLLILLHFFRQLSSPHAQQIFFTCSTSMHIVSNTIDVNRFYAVFFSLPFRKYPLFRFPPKKKKLFSICCTTYYYFQRTRRFFFRLSIQNSKHVFGSHLLIHYKIDKIQYVCQ